MDGALPFPPNRSVVHEQFVIQPPMKGPMEKIILKFIDPDGQTNIFVLEENNAKQFFEQGHELTHSGIILASDAPPNRAQRRHP